MTTVNQDAPTKPAPPVLISGAVSSCSDWLDVRLSRQNSLFKDGRLLVWFSCGAASACALKLVAHLKPLALYCNTLRDEHTDNLRFLKDVQKWTGIKINTLSSTEYTTTDDVFEKRQYMSGHAGAPCTTELKKVPRLKFQWADDTHIFGYTAEEIPRIANFEANNPDMNLRGVAGAAGAEIYESQSGTVTWPGMTHVVTSDAQDRIREVQRSEDREWLTAVIKDRDVQTTVRLAAERRLRKISR